MNKEAITLTEILNPIMKATGHIPGPLPRSMSGSLPGTLIWSLLGAGAGRYIGAPIIRALNPELDEDRVNRASTVMGGMAGFAPGAYLMHKTWQGAGGPKGLIGGLQNLKSEPATVQGAASEKSGKVASVNLRRLRTKSSMFGLTRPISPMWNQPSIPMTATQNTLDTAVYNGVLSPYQSANLVQIMEEARPQGSGLIAPSSIARAAVSYGLGALAGRALGAVANATFGSFSPGEQKNLARGMGVGNVLFDILGRLSS